jgi:hypothetical protein
MAYVDHAFSITDDDDLIGGAVGGPRGAPVKEIAFAAALLAFGVLGVVGGLVMAANRVGGDRAHGESLSGLADLPPFFLLRMTPFLLPPRLIRAPLLAAASNRLGFA